jgi:hypothetical protein
VTAHLTKEELEGLSVADLVAHAIDRQARVEELSETVHRLAWSIEASAIYAARGVVEEVTREFLSADVLFAGRSGSDLRMLTRIAGQPFTVGALRSCLEGE